MTSASSALPRGLVGLYALPAAGVGFMLFLVSIWFLKFATDVLLLAPGAVALLFAAARIWDAVIDPLAGWLSDRTRSRLGRRRPYMLAGAVALPLSFYWLFNPPPALPGPALLAWSAAGLFLVYTASTSFLVPHQALGAELSSDPHQRSRLFGMNYVTWQVGAAAAMATLAWVEAADAPRELLPRITLPLAALSLVLMGACTLRLRERSDYQGRGGPSVLRAFADVWRNPHARPLLLAFFIDSVGMAGTGILAPYVADYLLGGPQMLLFFFGFYMVPAVALAPLWPRLGQRLGKKRLWVGSLCLAAFAYGAIFFVVGGPLWQLCGMAALIGIAGSCAQVMVPSLLADVIDWDEWSTGERKEGAYSAMRTFLYKSAFGVMVVAVGSTLEWAGYRAGAAQNETTELALRTLFALMPAACYLATVAYVLPAFRYGEVQHAEIREALAERAAAANRL